MIPGLILAATVALSGDRNVISQHITKCQTEFKNYETVGVAKVAVDCNNASLETHYYGAHLKYQKDRDYSDAVAAYLGVVAASALSDSGNVMGAEMKFYAMRSVAKDILKRHVANPKALQIAAFVVAAATQLLDKLSHSPNGPPTT